MKKSLPLILAALLTAGLYALRPADAADAPKTDAPGAAASTALALFNERVAGILEAHCVGCHNDETRKGGLSWQNAAGLSGGSSNGPVVVPGKPDASKVIALVSGDNPKMPKKGDPLTPDEVDALRKWIELGAAFPAGRELEDKYEASADWWSLAPIANPAPPELDETGERWARNAIDRFVYTKLKEKGLSPSPEADRRTLIRRVYYNLIGLPPDPADVERFVNDKDPYAYEKLVDALLDSPRYGERWARHWLDVAHYGDTHGFDKDQLRPNAWPYRDYVIRALNEDKSYGRFVKEQIAGDVLFPDDPDGVLGMGFLAAGPWDLVGQIEVRDGTMEKTQVRNLDRDDMVTVISNTFVSMTVQCARCHNHKFDPISQEDYYSMQAVIAAIDRADRPYDVDPQTASKRLAAERKLAGLRHERQVIERRINGRIKGDLDKIDQRVAALDGKGGNKRPEFGYHSAIVGSPNVEKWVQVDLGEPRAVGSVVLHPCHDDFAGIGAGFGFPVRYRVAVSDDAAFKDGVTVIGDFTDKDQANPGLLPTTVSANAPAGVKARYVRVTATQLGERQNDFILALAELRVLPPGAGADAADDQNLAAGKAVSALDTIEAKPRWSAGNLTDGIYYTGGLTAGEQSELAALREKRSALFDEAATPEERERMSALDGETAAAAKEVEALPKSTALVYAGATEFQPRGSFSATGGKPRVVYRLHRGSEQAPMIDEGPMTPSAISAVSKSSDLAHHFDLPTDHAEGARRAALARWITDPKNPLTWRSAVNRVWQYHFGMGIVATPNDFGRMGAEPTHPELLDWLATWFRDNGQSLKTLHRLIVTSATYRQSSAGDAEKAKVDGSNQYLWRQNRQKLEAEPIRDATLKVAGKLDLTMGGPGFQVFGLKLDHSPHYKYHEYDPRDAATHRRAIYRFVVRSVPDPFMGSLDCADPSQIVEKRIETLTALQALALMNNDFMIVMSEYFAERVEGMGGTVAEQIDAAYRLALGRSVTVDELGVLVPLATEHGMANVCRLVLNSNEFIFID